MFLKLFIVFLVICQRVAELVLARRNTERLMAQGGIEHGQRHYFVIVALHVSWIIALLYLAVQPGEILWVFLGLFVGLQALRFWVILSLGPYWTTRIITLANRPLIRTGPYRFCRHPNYMIVLLELPLLLMAFDGLRLALSFGIANLLLLLWRIKAETRALSGRP